MVQQVCHLHFQLEDIEWETSLFNEKTGTMFTAKLKVPRLRKGAVPTKLPNAPSYLSTSTTTRESPDVRRKRKREAEIQAATAKRIEDDMNYQRQSSFSSLDELESKLSCLDSYWSVKRREESLQIYSTSGYPHTERSTSLLIDKDCAVQAYVNKVEMQALGRYKIPTVINTITSLQELLTHLKKCELQGHATDSSRVIFLLQFAIAALSLLKDES